jgi:hypothetical protein
LSAEPGLVDRGVHNFESETEESRDLLLPMLMKTDKDRRHLLLRSGFKHLLDDGEVFARRLHRAVEGDAA